jgi:uncharacterized protein
MTLFSLVYTPKEHRFVPRLCMRGVGEMMWSILLTAIGLLFVFEGVLPFLSPGFWRQVMDKVFAQSDRAVRIMGLISMLIGLAFVCIARDFY